MNRITIILLSVVALLLVGGIFVGTHARRLTQAVDDLGSQVSDLTVRVEEAEERVVAAEERAVAAEGFAKGAEEKAREAEQRADQSEVEARVAERLAAEEQDRARQAVEEKKAATETRKRAEEARREAEKRARQAAIETERAAYEALEARQEAARLRKEREKTLNRLYRTLETIAETRRSALGLVMNLGDSIEFDFDKAELRPENREILSRIAGVLMTAEGFTIQVFGHTDDVGTDEYNRQLSERRAQTVRDFLVESGINPGIISIRGYGKSQPLEEGSDPASRQRNRRVEIAVVQVTGGLPVDPAVEDHGGS
jgi:outer membrane protein OmpA-like peptidoglycan-associated protein